MSNQNNIAIIIPALNEEGAIKKLLLEIAPTSAKWIIVVDNGSTDRTAQVAKDAGAMVVTEPIAGYGRACWKGLQTALNLGAELLIFMDGDGSDDPTDIPQMLAPILEGRADLTVGSRISHHAEQGAIPPQARLGNWLVSHMISFLYTAQIHDIGSFRAIRSEKLVALNMHEMTFGWPVEMLVKAARAQYHILEIPIHYRRRSHGKSKVAGTVLGSMKAAYFMLSTTLRYVGKESHG